MSTVLPGYCDSAGLEKLLSLALINYN